MEFFTRVLSGNSRLKERAREAEQINQAFKESLDNLRGLLESEESTDVCALLDMVYESSFPEEQIFLKIPSRARLKSKKELLVRLLIGLDALGVSTMAEMLVFVRKHGVEGIELSLLTLLELLSPLLEGKEAPEFTTDDVLDAMDSEWHSTSRTGSPLLNVIASATSSPRASAASVSDSPLHPIVTGSPYRRAFSDRSMLLSRSHELGAKFVLDKTSTFMSPHRSNLTMSASTQYPSTNQHFWSGEREIPASPEIIALPSIDEKPPSYSLDSLPASSEHGLQQRHRRKSSSLRELFVEDTIDEMSRENSIGTSSKRNSSSSSWRRNSSDFVKFSTNVSGPSSPFNPGLATGEYCRDGGADKEILSSIQTPDRQVNWSKRGSHRISPSAPPEEVALWREDSDAFMVDLVSNKKNPAQTSVPSPIHQKSSGDIHETENHSEVVEAAPLPNDAVKSSKSTLEQVDTLPCEPVSLSNEIRDESPGSMSRDVSSGKEQAVTLGEELSELEEPSFEADLCHAEKLILQEDLDYAIDVQIGEFAAQKPLGADGSHDMLRKEAFEHHNDIHEQDAYKDYGHDRLEAITSVLANIGDLLATQRDCSEDDGNKCKHVDTDSISDNDHDRASPHDNTDSSSESDTHERSSANSSTCTSNSSHWSSSAQEAQFDTTDCNAPLKNQLKKHTFEGASDKDLQLDQSCNVSQHGHHRSQSDLTPVRSLPNAESLMQQQKLNGSLSNCHVETDILGRRFGKPLRSLTASMKSLMVREGSPDRAVESMPWMHENEGNHGKVESEEHGRGSVASDPDFSSEESASSSPSRADDTGLETPSEDEKPLILHDLKAQILPTDVCNQPPVHELGSAQCERDADFQDNASHAHALERNHVEDGKHATYLLDITHVQKEAGHENSLDKREDDAKHAELLDNQHLNESKITSASEKINPNSSKQEGIGSQWSLAPLLLPSSSTVSQNLDDQPAKIHENEPLRDARQGDIQAGKAPLLKGEDKVLGEISCVSLQKDMVDSINDEIEDIELICTLLPSQDLQTTPEAGDSKHCSDPICAADMTNDIPLSLAHAGDIITKISSDKESDVPATTSHAEHNSPLPSDGKCISETDLSDLSDDLHRYNHIEIEGNTLEIQNCDARLSMKNSSLDENAASDGASMSSFNDGIKSILYADPVSHSLEDDMQHKSPEPVREDIHNIKGNVQPMDLDVDVVSVPYGSHDQAPSIASAGWEEKLKCSDDQFEQLLSELDANGELPLINVQNDIEGGKMERHDDVTEGMRLGEDFARRPDDEEMELHTEKNMQSGDEKTRHGDGQMMPVADDNAGKELGDGGQFIMGAPRHIPGLVDFDDCSHCMLDNSQAHQSNPSLQDVESNLEQEEQDYRGLHENTDGNMHSYPLQSHSLASPKDQEAYKEATSKLDQDKQGLECPFTVAEVLQEGEISKPCWELSEVVEASRIHPLHDGDRVQQSVAQITDSGLAVQFTDTGMPYCAQSSEVVSASECHCSVDDQRIQQCVAQLTDSSTQYRRSPSAESAENDDPCSPIRAGDLASVEDHELRQSDHLYSPLSLSKTVDLQPADYANLHGQPTYLSTSIHMDAQQQIDQHVLNQPETFHGPTVDKWDIDSNEPRSKQRHFGCSRVRKLAHDCLSCCRKPHTIP